MDAAFVEPCIASGPGERTVAVFWEVILKTEYVESHVMQVTVGLLI